TTQLTAHSIAQSTLNSYVQSTAKSSLNSDVQSTIQSSALSSARSTSLCTSRSSQHSYTTQSTVIVNYPINYRTNSQTHSGSPIQHIQLEMHSNSPRNNDGDRGNLLQNANSEVHARRYHPGSNSNNNNDNINVIRENSVPDSGVCSPISSQPASLVIQDDSGESYPSWTHSVSHMHQEDDFLHVGVPPTSSHWEISQNINNHTDNYQSLPTYLIPNENVLTDNETNAFSDGLALRVAVSKNAKEVCNSSIREASVTETCTGFNNSTSNTLKQVNSLSSIQNNTISLDPTLTSIDTISNYSSSGQSSALLSPRLSEVSGSMQDVCSSLVHASYTATSNLNRVIRLLRQMTTLQLAADTPHVSESVLREIKDYDTQKQNTELQISQSVTQLQQEVAQVQELERVYSDQYKTLNQLTSNLSNLVSQVEEGLTTVGLQHLAPVTSPRRRSPLRTLEDLSSGISLLKGESVRQASRANTLKGELVRLEQEGEQARNMLLEKEHFLQTLETELTNVRNDSSISSEQLRQQLLSAAKRLEQVTEEKNMFSKIQQKASADNDIIIKKMRHDMTAQYTEMENRLKDADSKLQETVCEIRILCAEKQELEDEIRNKNQQIEGILADHEGLVDSLRRSLRQQQTEEEQLRQLMNKATNTRHTLENTIKDLKRQLEFGNEREEEQKSEIYRLKAEYKSEREQYTECNKVLQDKVDAAMANKIELEHKLRTKELAIMQLTTESKMEKQKSIGLSEEIKRMQNQLTQSQERLYNLSRRQRNYSNESGIAESVRGSPRVPQIVVSSINEADIYGNAQENLSEYGSLHSLANIVAESSGQLVAIQREAEEGRNREEHLHILLKEKDETLQDLQQSFAKQIEVKNQEVELVTSKVCLLEEQLGSLVSGLEVSAALGDVTNEVGRLLSERNSEIDSLDRSSHYMQEELRALEWENRSLSVELAGSLQNKTTIRDSQDAVRNAREEARDERLKSQHLQSQYSLLKVELDSCKYALDQERDERRLVETVRGAKHREFQSLLLNSEERSSGPLSQCSEWSEKS
ncbi:unnamed protein product, partial [Meganyctiphanes norvegica]